MKELRDGFCFSEVQAQEKNRESWDRLDLGSDWWVWDEVGFKQNMG